MSPRSTPSPTIAAWWQTWSTPSSTRSTVAGVAHVALDELGARVEVGRRAVAPRQRVEEVEHAHVVAELEQLVDDVRADEAGAAGDQDAHRRGMLAALVIDVVLPVLDEREALPGVLGAMPRGYRPIVADNGSTDGSGELARELGATVVREPQRGFGAACFAGPRRRRGRRRLLHGLRRLARPARPAAVADPVAAGAADLVLGARALERGAMPPHAQLANRVLAFELRRRTRLPLTDLGPMRAARRAGAARPRHRGPPLRLAARDGAARRRRGLADRGGAGALPRPRRAVEDHRHGARAPCAPCATCARSSPTSEADRQLDERRRRPVIGVEVAARPSSSKRSTRAGEEGQRLLQLGARQVRAEAVVDARAEGQRLAPAALGA